MASSQNIVDLPRIAPVLLRGFRLIAQRRLRGGFRAVRALHPERLAHAGAGPLIVYLNHPSWWDPLLCLVASAALQPGREHYAPISATALKKYPLFGRLGMFPVEQQSGQGSARGAVQFLRGAQAVLRSGGVLWVTAQGHFTDVRERPTVLKDGLGALLARTETATVIPMAVEYTFWNQRLPEALLAFGTPIPVRAGATTAQWTRLLEQHLETVQDELAAASRQRDPALFKTLIEGNSGTAGLYGAWQRLRARLRGERFAADHASEDAE